MSLVPFILRNTVRNRRRTTLTILSTAVSLFLICSLETLLEKVENPAPAPGSARRAVVRNAISLAATLPISYRERIRRIPGVEAVAAAQWFGGVYKDPGNFFAQYAVDAREFFEVYPEMHTAQPEQAAAFISNRTAALAGELLRKRFGWKVGDHITLKGVHFPVDLETVIVGFLSGGGNDGNFYFHWDYLNELVPEDATQTFFIMTSDPDRLAAAGEMIDATFANAPASTKTAAESAFIVQILSMWGNVRLLVASISSAVLFALVLASANAMAMSIRERVREIAVLRVLGFSPAAVVRMIILESSLICLLGGLFGSLAAKYIYASLNLYSLTSGLIQTLDVSWSLVFAALLTCLVVALISTLVPAWNAARLPITVALRKS
ncbi:MAG TPA: FtsX-like permease family protein [Terriglobia bacterium]|jgi:putative ABC transport system permease protein